MQTRRPRLRLLLLVLGMCNGVAERDLHAQQSSLLECTSTFVKEASAESLAKRFGASNVRSGEVYVGEGMYESGTVVFANSMEDRVEILWNDSQAQRLPRIVQIRGNKSHWRTASGLTLGIDLLTVERLNRRPFRLLGFEWDYQGTVTSWAGGTIGLPPSAPCTTLARLWRERANADLLKWYLQVVGDREFSSGHPAMQAINPSVIEVLLVYPPTKAR